MCRVGGNGAHRADLEALLLSEAADALGAELRVYHIYGFAFFDGLVGALRLAGPAAYAVVGNLVCHLNHPPDLSISIYNILWGNVSWLTFSPLWGYGSNLEVPEKCL
jgi:hypothetical protein